MWRAFTDMLQCATYPFPRIHFVCCRRRVLLFYILVGLCNRNPHETFRIDCQSEKYTETSLLTARRGRGGEARQRRMPRMINDTAGSGIEISTTPHKRTSRFSNETPEMTFRRQSGTGQRVPLPDLPFSGPVLECPLAR